MEDLDFADDLALMLHTKHQMQSKTDTLDEISKSIGLNIHAGKSKILTSERDTIERVTLRNTPLEIVESFTYLGSIIDGKGGTEADVRTRIGKARTAFANLSNVWKASKISISTKIRLFNSNVKSVLLYGCETWKTTQGVINKLQVFVNRCSRKILKLKWTDKIRNEQLWERTGQVPIQTEIGRRRWKWVGHTLRKGKNSITRQALQWNPQGSRGRGRPRETWRRCMEREMKDVGMTWVALSKKAQDRDVWRMFVCGLYPDRGERQ